MYFKTEKGTKNGKRMLKVTPNTKGQLIAIGIMFIFIIGGAILSTTVFEVDSSISGIVLGLTIGIGYTLTYTKEKKDILMRKKHGTDIIIEDPMGKKTPFWIETMD